MSDNKKIVKYRKPFHMNIGIAVFAIILIYICFYIFSYFTKEHIGVYEVKQGTIAENNTYIGLILREEEVYNSEFSGQLNLYVSDNSKAAWNNLIYSVDETGNVSSQLTAVSEAEQDLDSDYFKNLKTEVAQFNQNYGPDTFYMVYDFKDSVASKVMEAVNQHALDCVPDTALSADNAFHLVYAQNPGIVAYYTDGYEGITADSFKPEDMQPLDYHKNVIKNNSEIKAGEPVYKMITDENWNIICKITDDTYKRLAAENVVEIKFKKDNTTCWVNYELREMSGNYYVVLKLNSHMVRFSNERYMEIELLLNEKSGLKIPNSAITEKSFYTVPKDYFTKGGDSNLLGLYVEDEETGKITFVPTSIFHEEDTSYYISQEGIDNGTILKKPDSNETYEVNKQEQLEGVYNINKGYAVFKQIEVLFRNEEYTIVRSGTDYGISIYDHIALEGGKVAEDDFVH